MSQHRFVIAMALLVAGLSPAWGQLLGTPGLNNQGVGNQGLSNMDAAIQQRQIRGLEQRSASQPVGPEIDSQRRALIRDNGGVNFGGQGALLDRQLGAVPRGPQVTPAPPPTSTVDRDGNELSRTYGRDTAGLPSSTINPSEALPGQDAARGIAPGSSGDTVTTINRLISRAEDQLAGGHSDRARSDADLASRMLKGFDRVAPADASYPRLAAARERLNVLQDRLSGVN